MKIIVTRRIPETGIEMLVQTFGAESVWVHEEELPMTRSRLLEVLSGATAILCTITEKIDAEAMDAAGKQLKIIANMAVGYDNIDIAAAAARHIHVTNTPGVLTEATADLAWTLILGAARRAGEAERFLRAGLWKGWGPLQYLGASVHGKTLGIFGMGRIGQAVARRAHGFDMPILYCDQNRVDTETEQRLNARQVDKDTLLREADILTIHCPLTLETRHAFTLREFNLMKRSALLVNTSRGPVIKEEDLCAALQEGLIFAAGLDVYEFEPAVHSPLLEQERAVLLPHLGSATVETRSTMANMAAQNIITALSGQEPPNRILLPS